MLEAMEMDALLRTKVTQNIKGKPDKKWKN